MEADHDLVTDWLTLLGTIAHELRHTVGAVLHQLELLSLPGLDDELRERSAEALTLNAVDLMRFADGLTDLERVGRGEIEADVSAMDVVTLLDAAIHDRMELDGAVVEEAAPDNVTVMGDPSILRRVLVELFREADASGEMVIAEVVELPDAVEIVVGTDLTVSEWSVPRPVVIENGLRPFVAAGLARAGGARLVVEEAADHSTRFRLRLRLAP